MPPVKPSGLLIGLLGRFGLFWDVADGNNERFVKAYNNAQCELIEEF